MIGSLSHNTKKFDGYFLDGKGQAHPASTPLGSLERLGKEGDPDVVYVNGIMTSLDRQLEDMTRLAKLGNRVVGVHNATAGFFRDIGQSMMDKVNRGPNSAVTTVKSLVKTATAVGEQLKFVAHSQGALVVSRAIDELLKEEAVTPESLSKISVDTYGGASYTFPEGPKYHHHMNLCDPVPMLTGAGYQGMLKHPPGVKMEFFARVQAPYRVPGEPWGKTMTRTFDRAIHDTAVYFNPDYEGRGIVWEKGAKKALALNPA